MTTKERIENELSTALDHIGLELKVWKEEYFGRQSEDELVKHLADALIQAGVVFKEEHCKDCCCAQAWKALGVKEYDGMSIPEHIGKLKERIFELEGGFK